MRVLKDRTDSARPCFQRYNSNCALPATIFKRTASIPCLWHAAAFHSRFSARFRSIGPRYAHPLLRSLPTMPGDDEQRLWAGAAGHVLLAHTTAFVRTLPGYLPRRPGRPAEDATVLDFGCGWGRLARLVCKFVTALAPVGRRPVGPVDRAVQGARCARNLPRFVVDPPRARCAAGSGLDLRVFGLHPPSRRGRRNRAANADSTHVAGRPAAAVDPAGRGTGQRTTLPRSPRRDIRGSGPKPSMRARDTHSRRTISRQSKASSPTAIPR